MEGVLGGKVKLVLVCDKCGTTKHAFGCTNYLEYDMTLCPLCSDELADLLSDARCRIVSEFKKDRCCGKQT